MSAELSRRVEKVVGYPPLVDLDDLERREFHEALLEAATFEDLPAAARQGRLGVVECWWECRESLSSALGWPPGVFRSAARAVSARSGGVRRTRMRA
jgi:hypothetical protein